MMKFQTIYILLALSTTLTACRSKYQEPPRKHGVIIGYDVIKKQKHGGHCDIWYKLMFNLEGNRFKSRTVFRRSICCCRYNDVTTGVTLRIPERFLDSRLEEGE